MHTGYYASVLTIEILGRKWIQIQGFLLAGLFRKFALHLGCASRTLTLNTSP